MKDREKARTRICPACGQEYEGHPALSRADNHTEICPECGIREALESIGCTIRAEQNKIIALAMGKE